MAASLSQNLASVIDTIFLGYIGKQPLAAGTVSVMIFLTIGFIGLGLGTGIQVLAAHLLGEKRPQHLGDLFWQGVSISITLGVVLTLLTFAYIEPVLDLILSDPEVKSIATYFLRWRSLELIPIMIFGILRGFFSGIAQTKPIFHANLLLSAFSVSLNYLFVVVYNWGLRGVVISSVAAQYIATIYLFYALRWQSHSLRPSGQTTWWLSMAKYAGPAILQNIVGMVGWVIFSLVIERRGIFELASANVVRTLYSFAMLPTWAYATALGTLIGYFWATSDRVALRRAMGVALRVSLLTNLILACVLIASSAYSVRLFTEDAAIQSQVQKDLWVIAVSLLLMPPSAMLLSAVLAIGLTIQVFFVEVGVIALYLLYIRLLADWRASLTILWSADWVYWIPSALILGTLFSRKLRKTPHPVPVSLCVITCFLVLQSYSYYSHSVAVQGTL
jgi:putative MATE family efflux protein